MTNRVFVNSLTFLTALMLAVVAPVSMAADLGEPIRAFSQSSLQSTESIRSSGHLVLLSPVREIRGEIRSEVMPRLPVSGQGQLFEINRESSRDAAREHYRRELQARGGQILFECSGMACGRSNVWANQIFQQSGLLGRDNAQDYLVSAVADAEGQRWLTLVYTVTRGNLREYVWVEHLQVDAGADIPGFQSVAARILGPVVVPWQGGVTVRFDLATADRRRLVEWASEDGAEVVLAAFSTLESGESLDEATDRAVSAADALADVLGKSGISRSQIRTLAIGPGVQVADPNRQGDRIEVLVIKR
ncbi:DUF4892 domain-containing protein [Marinobacter sp.]|uniref:DUF4892 domain-containing protein n=1 Tax=Marinobacter sp. TaxID=50741 RepID=UPI0025B7CB53|nr:DUF4892 domain-containing protein [Marinobacter sp.]